jgi:hypothetical protein
MDEHYIDPGRYAAARERFLANPKRFFTLMLGLYVPEWFPESAREGDSASEVIITVPAPHFDFFSSETMSVLMTAASEHGIHLLFVRE